MASNGETKTVVLQLNFASESTPNLRRRTDPGCVRRSRETSEVAKGFWHDPSDRTGAIRWGTGVAGLRGWRRRLRAAGASYRFMGIWRKGK
ncbi:hypothetical protein HPP92_002005 [Vanilla planifolia]|uniref:Uncharacterized protein n=1 Tax=Vanilla planifolia TaxID=51239 RepID=A0A835RSN0_VANPL|nr:hypothetical protein HPP92_002005 [Vanilla planifolia]